MTGMMKLVPCVLHLAVFLNAFAPGSSAASDESATGRPDFDKSVAPLIAARCLECHNSTDLKGDLDLSSRAKVLKHEQPIIVPGNPSESLLWQQIESDQMPPKKPLSADEKLLFRKWIDSGAQWGQSETIDPFAYTTSSRAGADWWSLKPVVRPHVPVVKQSERVKNPIDAFVLAKLEERGMTLASPANRRELIRRLYFDVTGLPPSPEEISRFVADDSPNAIEKLIDQLLDSPHYGERWARHWLDVARYTESQGFEYDRFRPNAWHYRDYVINAFNSDKPYNIFVQEQIAGDVQNFSHPDQAASAEGMIATSLLVCGPWDQAGNAQANVTQKKITREEELEDLVSVVGQTFLGVTINCARCHSHKFDPVSQEDYYRFKAVFEGVRHGERAVESESDRQSRESRLTALRQQNADLQEQLKEMEQVARTAAAEKLSASPDATPDPASLSPARRYPPAPLARWTFQKDAADVVGALHGELTGGASVRDGRLIVSGNGQYLRTAPLNSGISEKTLEAWVALPTLQQGGGGVITLESDNGVRFDAIVFAEREPGCWIAGSTGFQRTQDLSAAQETSAPGELIHMAIVYRSDHSIAVYRNGRPWGSRYTKGSLQSYEAGKSHVLLGLRHLGAGNGFLNAEIESASLYDKVLTDDEIADSFNAGPDGGVVVTNEQMLAAMSDEQRQKYFSQRDTLRELQRQTVSLSQPPISYCGIRQQPAPTFRLVRGDVNSPAEVAVPAGLSVIRSPSGDLGLTADAPEAARRQQLAQWLAHPEHPLTSRVLVNRLWHHHFGRGIVETPNDFGFNGARPTHPELLDWLAAEFTEGPSPWSIRHIQKLILMSATWQQSSAYNEQAAAVDTDNTLLWRFTPRRLEGEIVRDAMLAVSGQLNAQMGGPSFKPFLVTSFNSDFYQPKDLTGPEFNRRSIYRANINSGKSSMMDALDCPDPSIKTPARRVTTTPLAALALMNNSFVQRQSEHLAQRVAAELPDTDRESAGMRRAWQICFGRDPAAEELEAGTRLVREHGLQQLCWTLLNATEFLYIH